MVRSVKEWRGATDDSPVPPRVRLRVIERQDHRCALCTREITRRNKAEIDHKVPLILGGINAEHNLWALCAVPCHQDKTRSEVKVKAQVAKARMDRVGIKRESIRPVPGSKRSRLQSKYNRQTGRFETVFRED